MKSLGVLSVALAAILAGAAPAAAEPTVNLYVGYPPGAAYEIYARLLSRHFGDHLPGQPTVVLRSMPGASSLVLANYLANVAPRDGNTLGGVHERIGVEPLVDPLAKFDGTKMTWIGSMLKTTDVCMVWHTSPAKTIAEAKTTSVVVGGANVAGSGTMDPRVLNAILGTKFKIVTGYEGPDIFLAMERGELNGRCGMSWSGLKTSKPDWLRDKKLIILIQLGLAKHPDLPNVPLLMDQPMSADDRAGLEYLFATQEMGRPYVAPPAVPKARATALRRAFDATMTDPKFLADAKKGDIEINPIAGEKVAAIVDRLYRTPKAIIDRIEAFRKPAPGESVKK